MRNLIIGIVIIIVSAHSLKLYSQEFSVQQGGHCFTLEIPEYLTKTYQLNDVASLQYMNALKESYVIVIEDSKDHLKEVGTKFIDSEDFLKNFIKDYQIESTNRKVSKIKNFVSNDFEHSQVEMSWESDGSELFMIITAVETQEHFYKILCWTLDQYKNDFKSDFKRISQSLKE